MYIRGHAAFNRCLFLSRRLVLNNQCARHQKIECTVRQISKRQISFSRTSFNEVSKVGFNDYESERNFTISVPKYFNFASDTIDNWAQKEKNDARNNETPAFWFVYEDGKEIKWSFQELVDESKRTAHFLQNVCGLRKGDHMMVILPKTPEVWLIMIAAIRIGIIFVFGSSQLTVKDLEYRFQAFKPVCVIADYSTAEVVDKVTLDVSAIKTKVLVSKVSNSRDGWRNYKDLQEASPPVHECAKTLSNETSFAYFTSGTEGPPKLVEHSYASYGLGHILTGKFWLDLTPSDIIWCFSDPGWAKAAFSSFYGPWIQGACVFIHEMQRFNPRKTLEVLQKYPISTFCCPPVGYRMLIQEDVQTYHFPKLNHCLSAGEALNPETLQKWKNDTGLAIHEGYGQTESTVLCATFHCIKQKPGSMGKPTPGIELTIVDDSANEVDSRIPGHVVIKVNSNYPPYLFKGYMNEPERTAQCFKNGYFWTGDTAYKDEEGYIYFVGRSDDVISSAGYRIGPFDIESALKEHPAVIEAAAVGSPDHKRGEVVKAFIILKDEYRNHNKDQLVQELQDHVKKTTAPYKYPRKIEFIDELPKTVSGKIQRAELRKREWNQH